MRWFCVRDNIVRVFRDGREVVDTRTARGKLEYRGRIEAMRVRQGGRCCLEDYAPMCPGRIAEDEATFEHEDGRGMGGGKRDDRIELPDGTWINGAAHQPCNNWKSSRYIDYNREANVRRQREGSIQDSVAS